MESLAETFADIEPIEQNEGPVPVVQIQYTHAFKTIMGYFRAILVKEEHSERALALSAEVIDHNAANYTAWQFRRKCVGELHKDSSAFEREAAWRDELTYCTEQCMNNMKNYQVWFHRRACVQAIGDASGELEFVALVLADDAKNYHAWGHRQWVLRTFKLWEGELAYVDKLLDEDLRNNSAWNQRWYVLSQSADLQSHDLVASEIAYALKYIALAPSNQSPWAYLKGLVEPLGWETFPQVRQATEAFARGEGVPEGSRPCIPALGILADLYEASSSPDDLPRAIAKCDELLVADEIRANYWRWRQAHMQKRAESAGAWSGPATAGGPVPVGGAAGGSSSSSDSGRAAAAVPGGAGGRDFTAGTERGESAAKDLD